MAVSTNMAVALLDVAAAARDCSRGYTRSGRAHRLIAASQCSRRNALLASVSTVAMSQLASEPSEAAAAELPLVPKAPLTADMDISQVSVMDDTGHGMCCKPLLVQLKYVNQRHERAGRMATMACSFIHRSCEL